MLYGRFLVRSKILQQFFILMRILDAWIHLFRFLSFLIYYLQMLAFIQKFGVQELQEEESQRKPAPSNVF